MSPSYAVRVADDRTCSRVQCWGLCRSAKPPAWGAIPSPMARSHAALSVSGARTQPKRQHWAAPEGSYRSKAPAHSSRSLRNESRTCATAPLRSRPSSLQLENQTGSSDRSSRAPLQAANAREQPVRVRRALVQRETVDIVAPGRCAQAWERRHGGGPVRLARARAVPGPPGACTGRPAPPRLGLSLWAWTGAWHTSDRSRRWQWGRGRHCHRPVDAARRRGRGPSAVAHLASAAQDSDQRHPSAKGEDQAHLDEHLQLALNALLRAVGKGLSAVATCNARRESGRAGAASHGISWAAAGHHGEPPGLDLEGGSVLRERPRRAAA